MMSTRLFRIDRLLTYAAAVAVVSATISVLLASAAPRSRQYRPGDKFATVAGFDPSRASSNVVIFVNSHCGHCRESAPAFDEIASVPRPRPFQVVVMGYQDNGALRDYVAQLAIRADLVLTVPRGTLRFAGVPQLAVLDNRGVIRFIWSGSNDILKATRTIPADVYSLVSLRRP
jgi:thiol-disulfide isomerase/thioredoxin